MNQYRALRSRADAAKHPKFSGSLINSSLLKRPIWGTFITCTSPSNCSIVAWRASCGYHGRHDRCYTYFEPNRARRSVGGRPTVAACLRRTAETGGGQVSRGKTGPDLASDRSGARRLYSPCRRREGEERNLRGHFFAAAAEAMRRILVDNALRKRSLKRGGEHCRVELDSQLFSPKSNSEDVLAVDEALGCLAQEDPQAAELVKLHFFAGCSIPEAAEFLGISRSNAYRQWAYARAALQCLLSDRSP